jgi:hypothetical protein
LVIKIEKTKLSVEHIVVEGGELLQNPVVAQLIEDIAERSSQAQAQCQRITEMYHALEQVVTDIGVRQSLRTSHDVSVGGLLGIGPVLRTSNTCKADAHVGKETCVRKMHMQ